MGGIFLVLVVKISKVKAEYSVPNVQWRRILSLVEVITLCESSSCQFTTLKSIKKPMAYVLNPRGLLTVIGRKLKKGTKFMIIR